MPFASDLAISAPSMGLFVINAARYSKSKKPRLGQPPLMATDVGVIGGEVTQRVYNNRHKKAIIKHTIIFLSPILFSILPILMPDVALLLGAILITLLSIVGDYWFWNPK